MNKRQKFGIAGSVCLFLGAFTPLLSGLNASLGSISSSSALAIVVLTASGVLYTLDRQYKSMLVVGISAGVTTLLLYATLFSGVFSYVGLGIAWLFLFAASGLLIASGLMKPDSPNEDLDADGQKKPSPLSFKLEEHWLYFALGAVLILLMFKPFDPRYAPWDRYGF